MKYSLTLFVLLASIFLSCTSKKRNAPMNEFLFHPEVILKNKSEIHLSEDQYFNIKSKYLENKPVYDSLNIILLKEKNIFEKIISKDSVDIATADSLLNQILKTEAMMKKMQLNVYAYSKNILNPNQIKQLKKIIK